MHLQWRFLVSALERIVEQTDATHLAETGVGVGSEHLFHVGENLRTVPFDEEAWGVAFEITVDSLDGMPAKLAQRAGSLIEPLKLRI